jgi:hypothetical protein
MYSEGSLSAVNNREPSFLRTTEMGCDLMNKLISMNLDGTSPRKVETGQIWRNAKDNFNFVLRVDMVDSRTTEQLFSDRRTDLSSNNFPQCGGRTFAVFALSSSVAHCPLCFKSWRFWNKLVLGLPV